MGMSNLSLMWYTVMSTRCSIKKFIFTQWLLNKNYIKTPCAVGETTSDHAVFQVLVFPGANILSLLNRHLVRDPGRHWNSFCYHKCICYSSDIGFHPSPCLCLQIRTLCWPRRSRTKVRLFLGGGGRKQMCTITPTTWIDVDLLFV